MRAHPLLLELRLDRNRADAKPNTHTAATLINAAALPRISRTRAASAGAAAAATRAAPADARGLGRSAAAAVRARAARLRGAAIASRLKNGARTAAAISALTSGLRACVLPHELHTHAAAADHVLLGDALAVAVAVVCATTAAIAAATTTAGAGATVAAAVAAAAARGRALRGFARREFDDRAPPVGQKPHKGDVAETSKVTVECCDRRRLRAQPAHGDAAAALAVVSAVRRVVRTIDAAVQHR